ncbi:2-dehydro-3-deoxygluconokinase [Virgibacillus phasianinus]|uniref:2-dehydro-3-deoxygluconokinase n=1 Tax=Virgibacillus phasianinus TaxID=2017483 RepID=A0A220U3D3_9BACI|nr:sugar kinase [Virgibacillus phasianinus]ASK62492.1 2-dehydro-3-deoxygluconokinase [Virgibacillus phasianinus]
MDVVTLGETMVLFTPKSSGLMRYAGDFSTKIAGAESNVAIGLARLGKQVGWISRLGNDEFGERIRNFIRGEGVDVSQVTVDDTAATGLYFKEKLTPGELRLNYYRQGSAASRMAAADIDEAYIAGANFLHVTGITPALSEQCYETVLTAIQYAKRNGVTVVFDPNLRRKLWSEERARKVLQELSAQADIVLPGIDEAEFIFGKATPEILAENFYNNGANKVILKLGKQGAYYLSAESSGFVKGFPVEQVVDPVGAGDGFAAGCLSGIVDGLALPEIVRRGNAVGAMVTMVDGDVEGLPEINRLNYFMNKIEREDVER